jgi:long-subunit fatty acid transport protein
MKVFALGATWQVTDRIDVGVDGMLTTVDARFPGTAPTPIALQVANRMDVRISSLEASMGVQVSPQWKLGVGVRTDAYSNPDHLDAPNPGGRNYTLLLSATYDFSLFGR